MFKCSYWTWDKSEGKYFWLAFKICYSLVYMKSGFLALGIFIHKMGILTKVNVTGCQVDGLLELIMTHPVYYVTNYNLSSLSILISNSCTKVFKKFTVQWVEFLLKKIDTYLS